MSVIAGRLGMVPRVVLGLLALPALLVIALWALGSAVQLLLFSDDLGETPHR